jgi:hypothetical protein
VTLTTLVTGGTAAAREAAIMAAISAPADTAVIIEGLPSGAGPLEPLAGDAGLQLARIAPGCPCCTGSLTMRVTLNRILRRKPARLYIGLASASHLDRIQHFLSSPPYTDLLEINAGIRI